MPAFTFDRLDARSRLVVLDAIDLGAGPVGAALSQRVPPGMHGTWVWTAPPSGGPGVA